jgi:hypothetical protein
MNKYEWAKVGMGIIGSEVIEDIKNYGRGNHSFSVAFIKKKTENTKKLS